MTPQEQQLIDGLVERIRSTQVTDKDVAAEQHLQQGLAGYPDALYVLAQTVLVQQYGLQQAQAKISDLQAQVESQQHPTQPAGGGSFLSHLFGSPGASQQQPPAPPYQPVNNPGYAPGYAPPYGGQPMYAQPVYAQPAGGGFLQGALQTAAGVAAGEMAFAGMESLFHGFGGGGFGGGGFGGGYGAGRPEEIVNNYYEDGDRGGRGEEHRDAGFSGRDEGGRDERLRDADYVSNDADDSGSGTDVGSDDASYDSGSDDGGGFSGDDGSSSF
jgi:hypothetical protein